MHTTEILIMPDFCSTGIWDGTDGIMIDYEDLNLSKELIQQFIKWINFYDAGYKKDYSGLKKQTIKPMNIEGMRLAKEIKKLYPFDKVIYKAELSNCKTTVKEITL